MRKLVLRKTKQSKGIENKRDKRTRSSRVKGSLSPTQPSSSNTPYGNIWPLWPVFLTFHLTLGKLHSSLGLDLEGSLRKLSLSGEASGCPPVYPYSTPRSPDHSIHHHYDNHHLDIYLPEVLYILY